MCCIEDPCCSFTHVDLMDTMVLLHCRDGVALVDIDVTSGGAGMSSAGGPFGHGVPGLDTSTAEGAAIDVCGGCNCPLWKRLRSNMLVRRTLLYWRLKWMLVGT